MRVQGAATAVSLALPRSPEAPGSARRFARDALEAWSATSSAAAVDLAVSELVTNAVLHGEGPIRLKLICRYGEVVVEVYDGSTAQPTLRQSAPSDFHGRGLRLVESVSDKWGVERSRDGKVVWCSIAC